jgi:hypothetical protein
MLYQQVAFLRERVLALKMAILQVTDKDRFSLCLLNAHYLDSDGRLWLFIKRSRKNLDAFADARHIKLNFFAPDKNFHVEGTGVSIPMTTQDAVTTDSASTDDMLVVKVDVSHIEYYEQETRQTQGGPLSLLYYKWLNFMDRHQSQRLLVLRRP